MTAEDGFVPTPPEVADYAAAVAFGAERPSVFDGGGRLLLPGLGTGRLYDAVRRYCDDGGGWPGCEEFDYPLPECVGVELVDDRVEAFRDEHSEAPIDVHHADFLLDPPEGPFDWVLANPPYLRYKEIDPAKREAYRERFRTAVGQFDLFCPFVEQCLRLVKRGGWVTLILPLSVLTTDGYEALRAELRTRFVGPITYLPEQSFGEKVETVVLSVQDVSHRRGDHLWLEGLYGYELESVLAGLGVDDLDAAAESYQEDFKRHKEFVTARDRRFLKKYDGAVERQQSLAEFGGETA